MQYNFDPAELTPEKLSAIQNLETEQDLILVAVAKDSEAAVTQTAELNDLELEKIQHLEKELNKVLIAYTQLHSQIRAQ